MSPYADSIVHNASVITLDPQRPRAQLVAIKAGRVVHVGSNSDRKSIEGRGTKVVDCQGKTLIPGFNDAHCHILAFAANLLSIDCSPAAVKSIADIKAHIRRKAETLPAGAWVRASGYNEFYLAERRHPNRWDLDEAVPQHPVKLAHRSGHACVLNSLALSIVGISMDSAELPGGMIDRDLDSGEPNGILFDMDHYLDGKIPPLSPDELEQGVALANEQYLAAGITSLQDATARNGLPQWRAFGRMHERGQLTPRLSVMLGISYLQEIQENGLPPRRGDDELRMGALKVILTETRGLIHPSQNELDALVLGAHRAGYQVAIHAVEEGTVAAATRALENARRCDPEPPLRHRIEHCSLCPPSLLERLKRSRAVVVTNPSFLYFSGERYLATVPHEQQQWLYRMGSFFQAGLVAAAGSDSPVVPINPLLGLQAAISRKAETGAALNSNERISPLQALQMYTSNAAYASFDEQVKGSISAGKLADFTLLDGDPTAVPAEAIPEIKVEMTIVGGSIAWHR